jgi:hypothetical protein
VTSWRGAALVAALGLGLLVAATPTAPLTGDGAHYVEFARTGLGHGAASAYHARRLLAPAIVHLLPLDPLLGYQLLTIAALFVAPLCLWAAATCLGLAGRRALAAIPLFYGTWAATPNLREYALVDPLAWALVAALWLATTGRAWWAASLLGAAAALTRETAALAALAAAASAWRCGSGAPVRRALLAVAVAAPALTTLVLLAVLVPSTSATTDAPAYVASWLATGLGSLGAARALYLVFASYGALWLLVPRGLAVAPTGLRPALVVFLLAAPVLPFFGSPERMEEAVFPALVTTALLATAQRPAWWVWLIALGNTLFVARIGGDAPVPAPAAWLGLALAVMLALAAFRRGPGATPGSALGSLARGAGARAPLSRGS